MIADHGCWKIDGIDGLSNSHLLLVAENISSGDDTLVGVCSLESSSLAIRATLCVLR